MVLGSDFLLVGRPLMWAEEMKVLVWADEMVGL